MNKSSFETLYGINVNEQTETKGRFTYLSWAYAVAELQKHYPDATWEVKRFGEERLPFQITPAGVFVEVGVTVKGRELTQIHPVLDNVNKPVAKPNSFQINASIQRCLAKAIALHGLGLYIYAGEDLPETNDSMSEENKNIISGLIKETNTNESKLLSYLLTKGVRVTSVYQAGDDVAEKIIEILNKKKEVESSGE